MGATATVRRPEGISHLEWVDRLKGVALIWIFLNHACERTLGYAAIGNPGPSWPPLMDRVRQLAPLRGHGVWDLPLNLFRWVGWLGDQGVQIFLILSGFGLAWSVLERQSRGPVRWKDFYIRRLFRLYPLWWGAHALIPIASVFGLLSGGHSLTRFLMSLAGIRVDTASFYSYSAAWWFIGLLIQLYLLFPVLWMGMARLGPLRFLLASAVVAAAARAIGMAIFTDYMDPWLRGSVFITRLPEFVVGLVLALWMHANRDQTVARLRQPLVVLGALVLYAAATAGSLTWAGMTVAPLLTGVGAFGVLFPLVSRSSRKGVLGWIGLHSYSFFLLHQMAIEKMVPAQEGITARTLLRLAGAVVVTGVGGLGLEWAVGRIGGVLKAWKERVGIRRVILRGGTLLAAGIAILVGMELLSRRLVPMEVQGWGERPSLEPDPDLGWRLKPSRTTRLRWESYDYRVTANALGYPGPDVPESRLPGSTRILVTGDAFSSAEGVDTDQAWPRLLESRLREEHPERRFEVLNFAITGYGPDQYARVLERFVPKFGPDLVIVEMYANDFLDALTPTDQFQNEIGFGNPEPDGLRSVVGLTNLRAWLRLHLVDPQISRLRGLPDSNGFLFSGLIFLERQPHDFWSEGARRLTLRLSEIQKLSESAGARLMVVSVPVAVQVCDRGQLPYFPSSLDLADGNRYDLDLPQRTLKGITDALKIPFVDLRAPLRRSPEVPCQPHNMHWTAAGHRAVAAYLASFLAADGKPPPTP